MVGAWGWSMTMQELLRVVRLDAQAARGPLLVRTAGGIAEAREALATSPRRPTFSTR